MTHETHDSEMMMMKNSPHDGMAEDETKSMSHHPTIGDYQMKMWFHFGTNEIILFDAWHPTSAGSMFGAVVICFMLSVLYEGLKLLREYLLLRTQKAQPAEYCSPTPVNRDDEGTVYISQPKHQDSSSSFPIFSLVHIVQTTIHLFQVCISYLLMLIFMTYNVWLCLGVVFGAATGYFVFGWKKKLLTVVSDSNEHCH